MTKEQLKENAIKVLKEIADKDNLGRVNLIPPQIKYQACRDRVSDEMSSMEFFETIKYLHSKYLIDADIPDIDLTRKTGPQNGTLQFRQEALEFLKTV